VLRLRPPVISPTRLPHWPPEPTCWRRR
jgi:hypothetical protein